MRKKLFKVVLVTGMFLATIIGLGHTENVSAAKMSLRISPKTFNVTLEPGQTYTEEFKVYNDGDMDASYKVDVSPYQVESTKDKYEAFYNINNEYTEIVEWTKVIEGAEGTIEQGGETTIKFTITVPNDAPGGGQYEVPLVTTVQGSNSTGDGISVGQNMSIGPIVYASVNGTTRRNAEIISNDINGFLFNPPFTSDAAVKNNGNIHTNLIHIMKVYPIFSNESVYNNEENPATALVLPGTTYYNSVNWTSDQGAPAIGIYKVVSEVKIFDEVSTVEKMVIVCPMWVLILILVFILAVIFWLVSRSKARKQ